MNIDPNISPDIIRQLAWTTDINEAKLSLLEGEELQQSTIEPSKQEKSDAISDIGTPVLTVPNYDVILSKAAEESVSSENLTDEAIQSTLDDFPEYAEFLSAQNLIAKSAIYASVRQKILENPGSLYSLKALAATALAEDMWGVYKATGESTVKEMWETIRVEILKINNPLAQVLIEANEKDLQRQGLSAEEAESEAIAKTLSELDAELSENGVITPFYGTHPKMNTAIAALLAAHFEDAAAAEKFVNSVENLADMKQDIINLFASIQLAQTSGASGSEKSLAANKNVLGSAEKIIEEAMAQIDKLPLPASQKNSLLAFMKKISAALALLKQLVSELSMADLQKSKAQFSSKVDQIISQLHTQLEEIRKAMRAIKKAKKKGGAFGILGKIMKILNKVMFAVMIIVMLALVVAMLVFFPVMMPLAIVGMAAMGAMFVFAVTSFGLSQSGQLDKLMDSLFNVAFMAMKDVLGINVSKQTAALILGGVLVGLLVVPILLTALLLPLLIVLAPLLVMLLPVIGALLVVGAAILLLVLMAVAALAVPLIFGFLPEMLVRSGILGTIASKIGGKLGMSENEINQLDAGLRGAVGGMTLAAGMSVSSSFGKLSEEDQKLVGEELRKKGDLAADESKEGRLAGYRNIGQVRTLNQLAAEKAASPEEIEKNKEELMEMIALLRKIIAQLEKLLAALMSGGGPEAMDEAIAAIQSIIDNEMPNFTSPSGQKIDVKPLIESSLRSIPNVLPSPEAIQEQLRKLQLRPDFYEQEEGDILKTKEIST